MSTTRGEKKVLVLPRLHLLVGSGRRLGDARQIEEGRIVEHGRAPVVAHGDADDQRLGVHDALHVVEGVRCEEAGLHEGDRCRGAAGR